MLFDAGQRIAMADGGSGGALRELLPAPDAARPGWRLISAGWRHEPPELDGDAEIVPVGPMFHHLAVGYPEPV